MRAEPRVHRARGFTLIESVILALIVGILSAVALPRFLILGADARQARAEAVHGAVRAAAQITRAHALLAGRLDTAGTVTVDGQAVDIVFGYPAASTSGIVRAAGLDPVAGRLIVLPDTPAAGTIRIAVAGARGACNVEYSEAASTTSAPRIVLNAPAVNGC